MVGENDFSYSKIQARLFQDLNGDQYRPEYHRCKLIYEKGEFIAYSTGNQQSSRFGSLVNSNGLIYLPASSNTFKKGTMMNVLLIGENYKMNSFQNSFIVSK